MRLLIQRVREASVAIEQKITAGISQGLLVLIGIENEDSSEDIEWLVNKLTNIRLFDDAAGIMNLSVRDIDGEILIVSQFTLHANVKKGNRPSYIRAAKGDVAIPLYEQFIAKTQIELGKKVGTGVFGADMQISLINDGPVTIWIDSKNKE